MDPTQFFGHAATDDSAVTTASSGDAGAQAQPGIPQGAAAAPGGEPAGQPLAHDPEGQSGETPPAPAFDPDEIAQLRQQNQQFQHTFQQIQGWAEQQQAQQIQQQVQQRYNERVQQARQTAENMSPREAIDYMARQMESINGEWMQNMSALQQHAAQQVEATKRALGTPLWVKDLVQKSGLPADAEQDLLALGDPALIERNLPRIKKRYEDNAALQRQLDQMSRSMQANQMVQNGAGLVGGTTAPSTPNIPADADPDTKATLIYQQLRRNAGLMP